MTEEDKTSDRRNHPRFPMRAYSQLTYSTHEWEVHILDISLSGARIALLDDHMLRPGDNIKLTINSDDVGRQEGTKKSLQLRGNIVHIKEHILGIEYQPTTELDQQLLVLLLARMDEV